MFDVIAKGRQPLGGHTVAPTILSIALHGVAVLVLLVVPFIASEQLPLVPSMMAFVATAPAVPPPPPPPAAPSAPSAKRASPTNPQPPSSPGTFAAPVEAPADIRPEPAAAGDLEGVEGGMEGGLSGGVVGGIVGGLTAAPLPLPEPPAPPAVQAPRGPVRVGGEIQTPALVHRVEPLYPEMALRAQIEGIVILEAVVDVDGRVESVEVLRSIRLLDNAAIAAVKQWRYKPLTLNGVPMSFVLSVTLSFTIRKE